MSFQKMSAVVTHLSSIAINRVVNRSLNEFIDRCVSDRRNGVFTVLIRNENSYPNYQGREGELGILYFSIVGQIELSESATGAEVENAELVMIDDFKKFAKSVFPEIIGGTLLKSVKYSMQVDRPYGWVVSEWSIE